MGVSALPARARIVELDVVRAVALIGVCVMNYHGYLIGDGAKYPPTNALERFFNPWNGPLSTRFAATFVTVAGMGITLLTDRSRITRDRSAISADRWKLVRRGVLLYAFGYFLDWVWPGTILFFYGAYFMIGALLFTLRTRWLVAIGVAAAAAGAALEFHVLRQSEDGHSLYWLTNGNATATRSPRDLVLDTFVRGTHPLLPWLVFLCMGLVLGRLLPFQRVVRWWLAGAGLVCLAAGYAIRHLADWHPTLESTAPFDHGVLYTLTTVGSSLLAVTLIGWVAQATAGSWPTKALGMAGRTTLTLYMGHVLLYNLLVHWWGWVEPGALGTALLFALAYWVVAVGAAVLWHRTFAYGPLEWVYRRFSDPAA